MLLGFKTVIIYANRLLFLSNGMFRQYTNNEKQYHKRIISYIDQLVHLKTRKGMTV